MADFHDPTSIYKNTKVKDFYLDLWNADDLDFPKSSDDVEYIIPAEYNHRPDLLANEIYGTISYWWVFPLRNKDILVDPINDFVTGLTIWIPSQNNIEAGY